MIGNHENLDNLLECIESRNESLRHIMKIGEVCARKRKGNRLEKTISRRPDVKVQTMSRREAKVQVHHYFHLIHDTTRKLSKQVQPKIKRKS